MIYLEPSIRREEEVYVIMENVGSFSRSPLQAHTRDPSGHSQVSPARGTPPIFPYW